VPGLVILRKEMKITATIVGDGEPFTEHRHRG
jgi:hypothetical protein